MHTIDAAETISRIVEMFPPAQQGQVRTSVAGALRGVVSQRLLERADGMGRVPAVEVMLNTKLVSELIEQGDFGGVKEAMEKSLAEGSQTFEQDLARLITQGLITRDEGLAFADSPTNLMWRLQNDMSPVSRVVPKKEDTDDQPTFTEITLDVRPDELSTRNATLTKY